MKHRRPIQDPRRDRPEPSPKPRPGSGREKDRLPWLFGVHSVRAVLASRPAEVRELVVLSGARGPRQELALRASELGIKVSEKSAAELDALIGADSHQGVAVSAPLPGYAELPELIERAPHVVVVLDGITDPQNLGAIARSAEALGASGIVVPADRSAGLSPAAHKASAGALEYLPVARVVNLARALAGLKRAGYWVYGADPDGDQTLGAVSFAERAALVVGSEGRGIRPGVKKEIDFLVRIPLRGRTSNLNASAASAIILARVLSKDSS